MPEDVNLDHAQMLLANIPDVIGVHDVHIWSLNSSKRNMWAHLVVGSGADNSAVLRAAEAAAASLACEHTCFQIEDKATAEAHDTCALERWRGK